MAADPEHELQTPTRESINASMAEARGRWAEEIRQYSHSQVDLWRQLPHLALQADGRSGYGSHARFLYEFGLQRVGGTSESGAGSHYIDCENGNVIFVPHGLNELDLDNLTSDDWVVELWGHEGKAFDAQEALDYYRQKAVEPIPDRGDEREDRWRERRRRLEEQLGMRTMYRRPETSTAD